MSDWTVRDVEVTKHSKDYVKISGVVTAGSKPRRYVDVALVQGDLEIHVETVAVDGLKPGRSRVFSNTEAATKYLKPDVEVVGEIVYSD